MATVYQAVDTVTNERVALKRLLLVDHPRRRRRHLQLFEREYHTLCHLAHPRIVAAADYRVDEDGPYYTMELLDGGDLARLAPLEWRRACAVARDVCSALSLLHSRRMVYRDLSPRNVRLTSDGLAKLIDFGAMVVMGPSKQLVGTPAYCPPEAVNLQPLDARTDLYALGATLYYTLTGRHAFPARDFRQLPTLWRSPPIPPSQFVPDLPPALDQLVLDLIQLDPPARPANAAEVMERLAAIEGRALDEQLLVSQAYLRTPTLVGRESQVSRARIKIMRALRGRGGALVFEGAPGVGRSRLLDACLLEAKLLGALVLRADQSDAREDYGVVRALFAQLIDGAGEIALAAAGPQLPLLRHAVPDLLVDESTELAHFGDEAQLRAALQPALRSWMLDVADCKPLVLAVDDLHAVDEPSAAFIALLAHELSRHGLVIAATVDSDARPIAASALKVLADAASHVPLSPLAAEDSEQLLRSVFGDVPHVQLVAHRLHEISHGNPRDTMQLAHHLIDRGLVRYQAGAWSLPATIDAADLPSSMAHALQQKIGALGQDARTLAAAFALCPDRRMGLEETMVLAGGSSAATALSLIDVLCEANVLSTDGESYGLAQRGWVPVLTSGLDPACAADAHRALAAVFELRGGDDDFRVAQHLLRAGDLERALDVFVEHARRSQELTDDNPEAFTRLWQSLPADWFEAYEHALRLCGELGRPKHHAYTLQSRCAALLGLMSINDDRYLPGLIEQLRLESGLADWAELDPAMEPMARLGRALELAQERYNTSPPEERVFEPVVAIRQLARALIQEMSVVTTSFDIARLWGLPSLGPLLPLSPALSVVDQLIDGVRARMSGRFEQARSCYLALLERTAQPDRAGLDSSHHRLMRLGMMNGLGLVEAAIGVESALAWAAQIEHEPSHQVNAELIRMTYNFALGDIGAAERCRARIDLLRIESTPRQWFEGTQLLSQVVVCAAIEDLTRMKQTIGEIEPLAARYPGWVIILHYALGEYHRIRGDNAGALQELEAALAAMEPGNHQLWPNAAGAHARVLIELGRTAEARQRGEADLAVAEQAGLGFAKMYIQMPLALSMAQLEQGEAAVVHANATVERLRALGSKGVMLALAHETRARVALFRHDQDDFESHASLCAQQLRIGGSRVVVARYDKLKQAARRAEVMITGDISLSADFTSVVTGSRLTSLLESCGGPSERAEQSLRLLLHYAGANSGLLYTLTDDGLELAAQVGHAEAPAHLAGEVQAFLDAHARDSETRTETAMFDASIPDVEWSREDQGHYRPVLLSHRSGDTLVVTGVAVVEIEPGARFMHPGLLAAQLSRVALESGDARPMTIGA